MITETVLLIAGLAGTLGVGIPIANSLASPHRWRSLWTAERPPRAEQRPRTDGSPAYKPLDLGPDPTHWPSERAWPARSTLREPQWPSRSWNDPHFGSHWRNSSAEHVQDRGFHAMAGRPPATSATPAQSPQHRTEPQRAERARPERIQDSWFQDSLEETRRRANEVRGRQQPARLQHATIIDPRPRSRASGPPERAELEQLIATAGLAGTVQAIMDRTGWEFREAAHYLAKIRSSR